MGAWGHGGFDNDDAADWVQEFENSGAPAVASALQYVADLPNDQYLEAPEASAAIAAAEVVAASVDGDQSKLSEPARRALAVHKQALTALSLSGAARRAVERVLEQSELKDLWEEGDGDDAWLEEVNALASRLR